MVTELRSDYHRQLEQISRGVSIALALVEEAIAAAKEAFLGGDEQAVDTVLRRRQEVEVIHDSLEGLVLTQLARQAPVAGELRLLVAVLRIVPELELTVALAGGVARRGATHLGAELTPRIRGLVATMFDQTAAMWRLLSDAYSERTVGIHDHVKTRDEEIDELHASLVAELASGLLRPPVLVDMALVARFLKRLGDHAVEVARWLDSITSP